MTFDQVLGGWGTFPVDGVLVESVSSLSGRAFGNALSMCEYSESQYSLFAVLQGN